MKKFLSIALVLVLALSLLPACGGGGNSGPSSSGSNGGGDDDTIDIEKVAEGLIDDAIASNSFSVAAADAAMKQRGVSVDLFAPDWVWTIDEEQMHAYGDTGSYGHGVVRYTKTSDGYLSDDDYRAWVAEAYMATAEISDNGFNIQGFDWGEGIVPKTIDEVFDGFVQTWSYIYDDTIMNVYVEIDGTQDSDYDQDDSGEWVWTHYYDYVQIDVGTGSQGEWNWDDLEAIFEEYEDEIKDALQDYTN